MIVSLDPGLHKVALAVWADDFKLAWAGLVIHQHEPGTERAQKWRDMAEWVEVAIRAAGCLMEIEFVCEIPKVYAGVHKEDPNDLIDLAGVVGAIVSKPLLATVEWSPIPSEWKGQLPKSVSQARVERKLSEAEKVRIVWPAKSLRHNVYDALHLGMVYLERQGLRDFTKS